LKEALGMPLIGRVAAGSPILAEEHIIGRYSVDPNLFRPRADYLLKVRGMSMRDAGILDGDLLAVHKTEEARSGQIVVARVHNEVTVKRLRRRGAQVELLPENSDFKPIIVDPRRELFAIEGVAVGIIRSRSL
jgi:repressor LexA